MYLKRLKISGFKNISEADIHFSPKLNCISGINGAGKSNLLDSVYYLSMTKSYFSSLDIHTISSQESLCRVSGEYIREDGTTDSIVLKLERDGGKQLSNNDKLYTRLSDHIGLIPIVMVSPYDSCLINESGDERRKFINSIISQLDREYLRKLQNYNQLLMQRNRALKSSTSNRDLLDTLTERMSLNASYIHKKRDEFIKILTPVTQRYYELLSSGRESISISYRSDLHQATLEELHRSNNEKDLAFKYTTSGIQRDDLIFFMDGNQFRLYGSQGQQKSFLIALKLAQFEIMSDIHKKPPLLLLDDLFDKLDMHRVESLLTLVSSSRFGQIFITDSNKVRIGEILNKINGSSLSIEINSGRVV
ncbi:MAG: DNA replication and repair protein RecF [Bacteroidales bacterium]|jgi:DNA replication and repair protein RecF|nr:DNA replication and repair protein RecF [Bacteroidales bacterium]